MSEGSGIGNTTPGRSQAEVEDELESMKRRAAELEAECKRIEQEADLLRSSTSTNATPTNNTRNSISGAPGVGVGDDGQNFVPAKDSHSIFIGNLDPSITPEDLQDFFKACGTVNRITILCNKITGKPKGFAYMEFEDEDSVEIACGLDETEMNGRPIKVSKKRANVPKFMLKRGRGRGGFNSSRGFNSRGRSRGRGRFNPYGY